MIFDAHAHIFPEQIADRAVQALSARYNVPPAGRATPDGLLRHMDECGVDRSALASIATSPSQVRSINSWLIGLGEPGLVPLGALHPACDDVADEVERLLDAGIPGVKLQPYFQGYTLDDPDLLRLLECIGDRLAVLMHAGQEIAPIQDVQPTPRRLLKLHQAFPQVRFIFAHLGGFRQWDEAEDVLVGQDVLLDASYVFDICSDQQIKRIIEGHGPGKIVWGSDYPWQPQSQGLAGVERLGLSEAEKGAVLGGNLTRLLGM